MAITGSSKTTAADRILGQSVTFDLQASSSGTPQASFIMDVDSFDWNYNPDMIELWPAGASRPTQQATRSKYVVNITAGQSDGGFDILFTTQDNFLGQYLQPPTYTLTRTLVTVSSGQRTQTFKGGVIASGSQSQGKGNEALTQKITINFDSMTIS